MQTNNDRQSIYWMERPNQKVIIGVYAIIASAAIGGLVCGLTGLVGYFPPEIGFGIETAAVIAAGIFTLYLLNTKDPEIPLIMETSQIVTEEPLYIEPSERSLQFQQLAELYEQGTAKIHKLRHEQTWPQLTDSREETERKVKSLIAGVRSLSLELMDCEFHSREIGDLEGLIEKEWIPRSIIEAAIKLHDELKVKFQEHLKSKSDETFAQLFQEHETLFNFDYDIKGEVERVENLLRTTYLIDEDSLERTKENVRRFIATFQSLTQALISQEFATEEMEKLKAFLEKYADRDEWWGFGEHDDQSAVGSDAGSAVAKFIRHYRGHLSNREAWTPATCAHIINRPLEVLMDDDWFHFPLFDFLDAKTLLEESQRKSNEFKSVIETKTMKSSFQQSLLSREYKIHLMPKPEHVLDTLEQVFKCLSESPELRDSISNIKVTRHPAAEKDKEGRYTPMIVIYPKLGKEHAQQALNGLVSGLSPYFGWGSNLLPRFNCRGKNPLIFYSQGDGKQKTVLKTKQPDVFKKLYDATGAHYHPSLGKGFPLQHPAGF